MTIRVQLTPRDTLPSILARLAGARDDRVLFVVPAGLNLAPVDLAALRREAAASHKAVALVTDDPALRAHAGRAGFSTFRSAERAERARWRRLHGGGKWPPRRDVRPVGPAVAEAPPRAGLYARRLPGGFRPFAYLRSFVRRRSPWWATLGLAVVLLLLWAGLIYALASILPAATVTLVPANEPLQVSVPLQAIVGQERADPDLGMVPARAVSVQVTGDARIATTGRSFEPSAKATGRVIFMNRTARQVTLPAGTVVATATGNNSRFVTTVEGKVEPGGRVTLPIEAVLPGVNGNVRAGTITEVEGPLGLSLAASNDAPTGGGGSTQVSVVTDEDKDRLQAQLLEQLKQRAFEKMTEGLAAGTFIPADSVDYLAMSPAFSPFVGDVSPELSLSMSVQAVGLLVDTSTGNEVALARLQRAMPPGSRMVADSVRYIPGSVSVKDEKTIEFSIVAQGTLLRAIDAGAARTAILGQPPDQARAILANRFALARPPSVSLGPDWLPYVIPSDVPSVPWRIRVLVDWDAGAEIAMAK